MHYNYVADSFHKRNFVADFLHAKCDFRWKTPPPQPTILLVIKLD